MPSDRLNEFAPTPKQAVFLFMSCAVVAVVVFLCGVLVGQGLPLSSVLSDQSSPTRDAAGLSPYDGRPAIDLRSPNPSAAALAGDDLSYGERLEEVGLSEGLDRQELDEADINPPEEAESFTTDLLESGSELESRSEVLGLESVASEVSDSGRYTVQVAALRDREAAERVRKQLVDKGYPAFVAEPSAELPVQFFRVRVGQYVERSEAESVKNRLEYEEEFKPWITR